MIVFLSLWPQAQAAITTQSDIPPAGSIVSSSGDAFIIRESGEKKSAKPGLRVFSKEILKTRGTSLLSIQFADGSLLAMGPDSRIALNEFIYDPATKEGKLALRIKSGIYRFTQGQLKPVVPESVQIKLPSGLVVVHAASVLGQVTGSRSLIILPEIPPGSPFGHHLVVRNKVLGKYYETNITQPGFGSVIKAAHFKPSPAIKTRESDIEWLESMLIPKSEIKPQESTEDESGISIQAIVYDSEGRLNAKFVVIGGTLYEEGAVVDDHEILTIGPDGVQLRDMISGSVRTVGVDVESIDQDTSTDEKLDIASILYDAQHRQNSFAYINGKLCREGDYMQFYKILEIKPYHVVLQKKGSLEPEAVPLEKNHLIEIEKELPPLLLQSIAYDENPGKSFATINSRSYRLGEKVEGYSIDRIEPEAVWIRRSDSIPAEKIPLEKGQNESDDEKPAIHIQIILYHPEAPGKSQVAIDSTLYKTGDLIEGYEILEIHKSFIRVRKKMRSPWRSYVIWELK